MKGRIVIAAVALMALVGSVQFAWAQGKAHITELRELEHETSPPLDKIPPLPPEAGPKQIIPLRLTHGPFAPHEEKADQALQTTTATSSLPGTSQNFLGLGSGFSGPNGSFTVQYIPPDTNGAAGDTQFVQWVNASFAVFDKATGTPTYGPAAGNTLWQSLGGPCASNNSGDPIAQYDKIANRWVLMQPVFRSPYYLCVAVSTTSDATGSFNLYAFPIPGKQFPDYPKLGVWPDGYYVTYNQFKGNFFQGPAVCAMDRAAMLNGNTATMQCATSIGTQYGSMLPGDFDGTTASLPPAGSPAYVLNFGSDHQSLDLWQMHVDWSNVSNSNLTHVSKIGVTPFTEACGGGDCIPQKGTSQTLDSLGDRLMYRLAYRSFPGATQPYQSLLVNQSVDISSSQTGIRWYELRNDGTGFTVNQQSTYAPDSSYRWMGSIAQDKNGNIAVGYSVSGSSMSPTIRFAGRVPGDPLNTLEPETDLLPGISHGSQTGYTRWGDYSSMAIDPADDCTFWYTTEYQPTNGNAWATRIVSFAFPSCTGGSSTTVSSVSLDPTSVVGGNSATGTVTLSAAAPTGGATVSLSSSDPSVAQVDPSVTVLEGQTSATFNVNTSTVSASTDVTITASYNSSSQIATLTVNPASSSVTVSSLTLNPTSVDGGTSSTGTVTLSAAAPTGGASVTLTNSNTSVATVPASVTVNQGQTSASFTVTTSTVSTSTDVIITASYNSSSQSATLTVNPTTSNGDFSISATPGNVTLKGSGTATYSVSIAPSNGYTGTVNLSVTGIDPSTMSASFSPAQITNGSGTSTLTVDSTASRGNYTFTITGTDSSGNPVHSTTVGFKVR